MCEASGLTAVEPLWGESTDALFDEWIASGAEALIVTARAEFLDETWLGRTLTAEMAAEFRGSAWTRAANAASTTRSSRTPLFSRPLALRAAASSSTRGAGRSISIRSIRRSCQAA